MMNKTCCDCSFLIDGYCGYHQKKIGIIEPVCEEFEQMPEQKPTNGDVIRQMSDEELATWGMYDLGTCPTFEKQQSCPKRGECSASEVEDCWLAWLNAPADCVAENGKSAKQADLCCKSAKESEGEDEP